MTTDPFRCDAVFSVALLIAFVSLSPALFTVTLPDWIIVSAKPRGHVACANSISECAPDRNSASQNMSDDNLDETTLPPNSVTEAAAAAANYTSAEDLSENNTAQQAVTRRQVEQNEERKTRFETVLLANLNYICVRNATKKTLKCENIILSNSSQDHRTCTQDDNAAAAPNFEDDIDCSVQAIRNAMLSLAQYAFPCIVSASVVSLVSTVVLNGFAVADKGYPVVKFTVGVVLLGSATLQIFILLQLRFALTNLSDHLGLIDASEARHGAAAYFSSTTCALTLVAAGLLFISSHKEKLPIKNPAISNADVPFQSNSESNRDETQDFDEFMKIQEDESEEWGFNPKAIDMPKDVRFRLLQHCPETYLVESENEENVPQSSDHCDHEPPSISTITERNNRDKIAIEDCGTTVLKRFNSDEFDVEENFSYPLTDGQQSKMETSVKRVAFVLPEVSDESVEKKESVPHIDDHCDVTTTPPNSTNDKAEAASGLHEVTTSTENCPNSRAEDKSFETDNILPISTNNLKQWQAHNHLAEEHNFDIAEGTNVDFAEYPLVGLPESTEGDNEDTASTSQESQ